MTGNYKLANDIIHHADILIYRPVFNFIQESDLLPEPDRAEPN